MLLRILLYVLVMLKFESQLSTIDKYKQIARAFGGFSVNLMIKPIIIIVKYYMVLLFTIIVKQSRIFETCVLSA